VEIKNLLTIVIPCKNERFRIKKILQDLNNQNDIKGTKVFIADSSDDISTRLYINSEQKNICDIKIIEGGLPSVARHNGAKLSTTPYTLFLDADMEILNKNFINEILGEIIKRKGFLLTCKIRTFSRDYNYIYKIFDIIQRLHWITKPFALGGIMLFKTEIYNKLGGFNIEDVIAEDYNLSRKISSFKFVLSKKIIFTDDRRFRKKGVWYMIKLMILTFLNKNNPNFYKKSFSYWS
jgi:glycosyltransferase involved in cell wall biosynthesis